MKNFFRKDNGTKGAPDPLGMEVLYPPNNGDDRDMIVDIVFVHGLGGSRLRTWSKDSVLWPRDFLPNDHPHARIMTWGYDADFVRFFDPTSKGNLSDKAKALNGALNQIRFEDYQMSRPLIFVAHSLGGLVVKDALYLSYREGVKTRPADVDKRIASIKQATRAILFAGTPHRGTEKAKWAVTAARLSQFISANSSRELVKSMMRGSDTVLRLQDSFKDIIEDFVIYTLLEELNWGKVGLIVEKESALIGHHEKEYMLHGDHSGMIKFKDKTDDSYRTISGIIKEVVHDRIEPGAREQDPLRMAQTIHADPQLNRGWRNSPEHIYTNLTPNPENSATAPPYPHNSRITAPQRLIEAPPAQEAQLAPSIAGPSRMQPRNRASNSSQQDAEQTNGQELSMDDFSR